MALVTGGALAYPQTDDQSQAIPPGYELAPPAEDGGIPAGYELAPPQAPQLEGPARPWLQTLSNLVKGGVSSLGTPGDIDDYLSSKFKQYVYDPYVHPAVKAAMTDVFGEPKGQPLNQNQLMVGNPLNSQNLTAGLRAVGAVDNPALAPQNAPERYAAAASQATGGALAMAPISGPISLPTLLKTGAQGTGAGIATQGVNENLDPNSPWAPAVRLLAGVAGGTVGGLGFDITNRLAGAINPLGSVNPTASAYDRLGIPKVLAGDVTGNKFLQNVQATGSKLLGGGGIQTAQENTINKWSDALEETADRLGTARTPIQAGTSLQNASQDWLDAFRRGSTALYNKLSSLVPGNTPTPLTNYATTLNNVRATMPTLPATARAVTPGFTSDLLDSLISDVQKGPTDWQSVQALRTRIGDMLGNSQIIGDPNYRDLKRIYGALSQDMQNAAYAQGHQAGMAFNDANAYTSAGHDFIDNHLSRWYAPRNGMTPERSVAVAFGDQGTTLQQIRGALPDYAADNLAAYKLRDMGLATPGQQNAAGTKASPTSFITDNARLQPQQSDALFGNNPWVRQRVDDLATVGDSMRSTEKSYLNTSGTAGATAMIHALSALGEMGPAAFVGWKEGGFPGAIIGAGTAAGPSLFPGFLAKQAVATPWLTRAMSRLPASGGYVNVPGPMRSGMQIPGLLGY